ncbi:DUF7341 domain-containing protein [Sediminivirga luteola]|uniref:DUF7341 domain-containing protein n=1 Tax=Sediminivirga luteola TaxID=1774748 RepID=A0A8J2XK15_9MICO|nr:hypothetical protein [Sediminivirga luteola]GGA10772.1 hypothetical protein GCM10011333_11990 [Sediminivirga luteola]
MNLDHALHQLTETHYVQHHVQGEGMRSRAEAPLLQLLQDARQAGGEQARGTSRRSEKAPVALDALDLWMEIAETVATQYYLLTGRDDTRRPVIGKLRIWVGSMTKPRQQANAEELLAGWVQRIRALLDPPRTIQLWERPCPECHAREVTISDRRTAALHILTDRMTQKSWAECQVCHETWPGGEALVELAETLGRRAPSGTRLDLPA